MLKLLGCPHRENGILFVQLTMVYRVQYLFTKRGRCVGMACVTCQMDVTMLLDLFFLELFPFVLLMYHRSVGLTNKNKGDTLSIMAPECSCAS